MNLTHDHHRRATFIRWLRKTHSWFGLWGATLGLLFGISGVWLNHRAVLKLPPVAQQRSESQIQLPDPAPATAPDLAAWLQRSLQLPDPPTNVRVEPARRVPWAEKGEKGEKNREAPPPLMQPERWTITFGSPMSNIQAETWAGNRSVSVRRVDNGLLGTLMNLHKGVGMSVPWILLIDTLAGSLILLSISGVLLWMQTSRRRMVGATIFAVSLATTLGLALARL